MEGHNNEDKGKEETWGCIKNFYDRNKRANQTN
jgi:hypothetical protein